MDIVAIGRTKFLSQAVRRLHSDGHAIELVVTCDPADFYETDTEDFEALADEVGAEFLVTKQFTVDDLTAHGVRESSVGVSVNWKSRIGSAVLEWFDHGIINYHAGDLPRYRGNAAMNWAILQGEDQIVHTLHYMSEALDAGPILEQRTMPIDDDTRLGDVYEFAEDVVPEMFVSVLSALERGTLDPTPQPESGDEVLRCYPRRLEDSEIDWSASAEHIARLVRASSEPLFGAFTYRERERLIVWRARAETPAFDWLGTPGQVAEIRPDEGEVAVATGEGFLVLEEVQPENGARRSAADVITSARTRLGMNVRGEIRDLHRRITEMQDDTTH